MQEDSAKKISKKSKSSFYYAFNLLPADKRDAMNTVYAFCRKTDDIVDETSEPKQIKYNNLVRWREQLDLAFQKKSTSPLLNGVAKVINQFKIPHDPFFDLIKGMEMDLSKDRYENFEELYTYCYRAASTVGLMCIEIFGYKNPTSKQFAIDLGIALQLTNIIRDVKKDAQIGRIYLPKEDLDRFGYSEEELFNNVYNDNFVQLMKFEAERALDYFRRATLALDRKDKKAMFAARAMQHIYFRLLKNIIREGYDVFGKNIRVNSFHKIGIALAVWAKYRLVY